MPFKMRNAYCLRSAAPFVVIYLLEDSLTHEDIASHLGTCSGETVNHTSGVASISEGLCVEECKSQVQPYLCILIL